MMRFLSILGLLALLLGACSSDSSTPTDAGQDAGHDAGQGDQPGGDDGGVEPDGQAGDEDPHGLWLFESARSQQESMAMELVNAGIPVVESYLALHAGDPLMLDEFLTRIENRGVLATQEDKQHAQKILDNFAQVEGYIWSLVSGVRTMESVTAAVAASRLLALAVNQDLIDPIDRGNGKQGGLADDWLYLMDSLTFGMPADIAKPMVLSGDDCGEAPPADGSLPPSESEGQATLFVGSASDHMANLTFELVGEQKRHGAYVREYISRLHWHRLRRATAEGEHDLYHLGQKYIDRLREVLTLVAEAPFYDTKHPAASRSPKQGQLDISAEQLKLFSAIQHRLWYGARLSETLTGLVHPSDLNEEPFHYVPNAANLVDGRYWPIIWSNGITVEGSATTSWVNVYFDNPGHLAADFDLRRTSRELSHIDYRVRVMNDSAVLREFLHEPVDGEIALGQTINPIMLNPHEESWETYVVHMVAMDQANHPSDGSCNFINIHWIPAPEPGSEDDPESHGFGTYDLIPPMHYDLICRDWDMAPMTSLGLLPRNVYIRHGATRYWVEPSTLHIVTSGESLYVNNYDETGHRFVTTSNSRFGIPGSVGGIDRELDTGMIAPGGQQLIELPTGLPSPYWFNLVEVEQDDAGNITGVNEDGRRIHIMVQNPDCLKD